MVVPCQADDSVHTWYIRWLNIETVAVATDQCQTGVDWRL